MKEACKVLSASKIAVTQCYHLAGMFCRLSENVSHLLTACYVWVFACISIWVAYKCLFGIPVASSIFCHLDNLINNKLWVINYLIHSLDLSLCCIIQFCMDSLTQNWFLSLSWQAFAAKHGQTRRSSHVWLQNLVN